MLEQLVRSWATVLTRPSVATFDGERPRAAMDRVLVGVAMAGLVAGIGSALGQFLLLAFLPALLSEEQRSGGLPLVGQIGLALAGVVVAPLASLIGFFIWAGVLFLMAKVLGGGGDFVGHSYVLSLAAAPITAIGGVLGIIPCLALLLGLPLFIYQLVLTTLALQSAHGFTVGRAVAAWLIPVAILFFLILCLVIAVVALVVFTIGAGG